MLSFLNVQTFFFSRSLLLEDEFTPFALLVALPPSQPQELELSFTTGFLVLLLPLLGPPPINAELSLLLSRVWVECGVTPRRRSSAVISKSNHRHRGLAFPLPGIAHVGRVQGTSPDLAHDRRRALPTSGASSSFRCTAAAVFQRRRPSRAPR